jgi:UDP-N-acetylmuramoyl-L-alanyl-D-glutamate--2,6-diaminopimelate ligase
LELSALIAVLSPCQTNEPARGQITGLAYNSKTVSPGELFFCLRGNFADGHDFAKEALDGGAAALVVEQLLPLNAMQVQVVDARQALLRAGRAFYGNPAARLGLVGVTGTNGKTTTAFYIRSILQRLKRPVGLIGTVYNQVGSEPEPSAMTTPESLDLWQLLGRAEREGCGWVAMEVSSHALAMHRVDPADFDIGVVLNITRDHFDYHGTFEHYRQSKARLVRELPPDPKPGRARAAVLNADEPEVAALAGSIEAPVITFGWSESADVRASAVTTRVSGSDFLLHLPGATPTPVHLPMPGRFNVANALAAAAVGWVAGVPLGAIAEGVAACQHVPGRSEIIDEGQPFSVMVDFAHNPDALAKVAALRPDSPGGRTILVFGAEGGKDRGKRPEMGAAARGADYAIITSDNMPKEEPAEVARQVGLGLGGHPHEVVLDRRAAIERALQLARPGDMVIIAGKGHEQTWFFGGQRIPFDDREVARTILRQLQPLDPSRSQ